MKKKKKDLHNYRVEYEATFRAWADIEAESENEAIELFDIKHVDYDHTSETTDWEATGNVELYD